MDDHVRDTLHKVEDITGAKEIPKWVLQAVIFGIVGFIVGKFILHTKP
jgi:hypothetical protein